MLEDFLSNYSSANTKRHYCSRIGVFLEHLNDLDKSIDAITREDVAKFLKNYSETTSNNYLTAIKMYYSHCTGKNLNIENNKLSYYSPDRNLSLKEVEKLVNSTNNYTHKVVIKLLTELGIRVSELLSSKEEDLKKLQGGFFLNIVAKGNKKRSIKLTKDQYEALKQLYSYNGGEIKLSVRHFERVVKQLGVEVLKRRVTPHMFRHCFATELMKQGCSFDFIRETLGHNCITTTLKYLHNKQDNKSYNIKIDV